MSVRDSAAAVNARRRRPRPKARPDSTLIQKPFIASVPPSSRRLLPRGRPAYDSRIHGRGDGDEEDGSAWDSGGGSGSTATAHANPSKAGKSRKLGKPSPITLDPGYKSVLRCGYDLRRKHYRVQNWAGAITRHGPDRGILGVVDYWLGPDRRGKVRARGRYLCKDEEGNLWYTISAKRLAAQIFGSVYQVRRAMDRLEAAGFLARQTHTYEGRDVGVRLALNWPAIDAAVAVAWAAGVDDEEE